MLLIINCRDSMRWAVVAARLPEDSSPKEVLAQIAEGIYERIPALTPPQF